MASPTNISLKLFIDTKGHRILFAEANKDFVDFLIFILSLPIGTVVRLFTEDGMIGCLGNLYESIKNLNDNYLQPDQFKYDILNPISYSEVNVPLLLPDVESTTPRKAYKCRIRCNLLSTSVGYATTPALNREKSQEGGFVKGQITYMITDDLEVKPMSSTSCSIAMLNKFNMKEVAALEEKVVNIDMDKGVKLLKASFQSKTVLTDVFFDK
ncbi:DUF674 domain-containing protein [Cephalotus follicularis]|uniref:DUF674 domain-containing protein n=1 Tax=Cephalotus follicularis TaxID=3775 RepID=A0A1Q3CA07_CEPFO|nr:DUF674 domain-containing protein [Cephalotus follicularis]